MTDKVKNRNEDEEEMRVKNGMAHLKILLLIKSLIV